MKFCISIKKFDFKKFIHEWALAIVIILSWYIPLFLGHKRFELSALAISILLYIKAVETVIINIIPNMLHGRERILRFENEKKLHGFEKARENYLKNRKYIMFLNMCVPKNLWFIADIFYRYILGDLFYRWFILVPIASVLLTFVHNGKVALITGISILVSIFIEVFNEIMERICNGKLSNIQFNTNIQVSITDFNKISYYKSFVIGRICKALVIRVAVIWISFACIYTSVNNLMRCSFSGMDGLIDPLYFSLITITTTGYGDIEPTNYITKLLVVFQLFHTWILIIVMILHYGVTVSDDLVQEIRNSRTGD